MVKTYALGGQRVAVRSDGEVNWLHSDHLSSVGATTDRNGTVVGRQLYEPYGAVRAEFGEVDGSWGWATHRKAKSYGLTFMRARWCPLLAHESACGMTGVAGCAGCKDSTNACARQ